MSAGIGIAGQAQKPPLPNMSEAKHAELAAARTAGLQTPSSPTNSTSTCMESATLALPSGNKEVVMQAHVQPMAMPAGAFKHEADCSDEKEHGDAEFHDYEKHVKVPFGRSSSFSRLGSGSIIKSSVRTDNQFYPWKRHTTQE